MAEADAERAAEALGLAMTRDTSNGWTSDRAVGKVARVTVDLSANVIVAGRSLQETDALSSPVPLTFGRLTLSVISPATTRARGR